MYGDSSQFINIFSDIAIAVISFACGYTTHWYINRRHKGIDKNTDTRTIITFVVLFLWAISVIVDMASAQYTTPVAMHGIFGAIVGFFYEKKVKDMISGIKK